MISAPLVATAFAIVIILQIVILLQIRRISSSKKEVKEAVPQFSEQKVMRRDYPVKEDRKEKQDSLQKTHQPVSTVEKSLRDINLRLKNAERDQENARKKMNEKDFRNPGRRPHHDKGKSFQRNRDGDNHDRTRGTQERQRPGFNPQAENNPPVPRPSPVDVSSRPKQEELIIQMPLPRPSPPEIPLQPKQEELIIQTPVQVEELFGRGSKITVKRRSLDKPEENDGIETEQTAERAEVNKPVSEMDLESEQVKTAPDETTGTGEQKLDSEEQKMSFGRR
jgi:hypothetical protein